MFQDNIDTFPYNTNPFLPLTEQPSYESDPEEKPHSATDSSEETPTERYVPTPLFIPSHPTMTTNAQNPNRGVPGFFDGNGNWQPLQMQAPVIQAPQAPTSKSLAAKPEQFSGRSADYETFRRQLLLYLLANRTRIVDDEMKIITALSYMSTGLADRWAQNFIDEISAATPAGQPTNLGTWDDFIKALDATFKDPNKEKNAQQKLYDWKQGNRTAEDFFTTFDQLRRAAGYAANHDMFLIQLLEQAVNRELVQAMYSGDQMPTTYDAWKDKAIRIDGLQRRFRSITGRDQRNGPPRITNTPQPNNNNQRTDGYRNQRPPTHQQQPHIP